MSQRAKSMYAMLLSLILVIGLQGYRVGVLQAQIQEDQPLTGLSFVPGRVLVQFRAQTLALQESNVVAELGARDAGEISGTEVHVLELPDGANEKAVLKALRSRPDVEFAELDHILPPAEMIPNDFWYSSEWHLPKISAPNAWPITSGSSSVTIAICDTGVDATHPGLAPKIVPGWNVYNNNSNTADVHGHGTAVAGAAASCSNNAIGVASVAWGCLIMPIRISDANGNATYSAMAYGITWAADHGARVANVSYIATDSSTVRAAAQYMQSRSGVVQYRRGTTARLTQRPIIRMY
jgi:thermitase